MGPKIADHDYCVNSVPPPPPRASSFVMSGFLNNNNGSTTNQNDMNNNSHHDVNERIKATAAVAAATRDDDIRNNVFLNNRNSCNSSSSSMVPPTATTSTLITPMKRNKANNRIMEVSDSYRRVNNISNTTTTTTPMATPNVNNSNPMTPLSCNSSVASYSTSSNRSGGSSLLLVDSNNKRRRRRPNQQRRRSNLVCCRKWNWNDLRRSLNHILPLSLTLFVFAFFVGTSLIVRSNHLFRRHIVIHNNHDMSPLSSSNDVGSLRQGRQDEQSSDELILSTNQQQPMSINMTYPNDIWYNDYNIVHVVQTRFMQFQPNLITLGYARLKLFQSVTIPSIVSQTNPNFLWIIRTDPLLHQSILQQLIQTLQDTFPSDDNTTADVDNSSYKRKMSVVLVASNDNPEGFRSEYCIHDITNATVLFGNVKIVQSYHTAAQDHTVLETRLDADDALAIQYIDNVQKSANTDLKNDWMVWCAENHMEWQYSSPWDNASKIGAIIGLKANQCITPGLTWGYTTQANRSDIPVSKHQQIFSKVPKCVRDKHHQQHGNITNRTGKCLMKLGTDKVPAALRARTPTSAGMDHVYISNHTEDKFPLEQIYKSVWRNVQSELYDALISLFGIDQDQLLSTRNYIESNLIAIVQDALDGQCTKGHSCKKGSKIVLQRLLVNTTVTTTTTAPNDNNNETAM